MKTNFTEVSMFNELIGNAKGAANIEQVFKQFGLITSEMSELLAGIEKLKDAAKMLASPSEDDRDQAEFDRDRALIEIRDGIADVLVTTYGLAHRMGIDADADMTEVQASNMSKFFRGTTELANAAAGLMSDELGLNIVIRKTAELPVDYASIDAKRPEPVYLWAFVSADDSDPERPRGKLLKAPGFKKPKFEI